MDISDVPDRYALVWQEIEVLDEIRLLIKNNVIDDATLRLPLSAGRRILGGYDAIIKRMEQLHDWAVALMPEHNAKIDAAMASDAQ